MDDHQLTILNILCSCLDEIGSANDAEDHGYLEEAQRMRRQACVSIRNLMAGHAFLGERFPTLQGELDSGHIFGFGWAELRDRVSELLQAGAGGHEDTPSPEAPDG